MNPVVIIPARMESTRLPGKPLADIAGKPMIVHVMERAQDAGIGPVYVACAEKEIYYAVTEAGGKAVMTNPNHPSGTDRIYEAFGKIKHANRFDVVVNVQGDLPLIKPKTILAIMKPLKNEEVDISTLVAPIDSEEEKNNPNVVKAIVNFSGDKKVAIAENFTRVLEAGEKSYYHHIGMYGYRRKALEKFISLKQSEREKLERLEQLRAMDNGIIIGAALVDDVPFGVDTKEDLEKARKIMQQE